jgi:hypothetical protein
MPAYVRVELHERSAYDKPTGETYELLHAQLAERGIERWVEVSEGGKKQLPSGLYYTKGADKYAIGKLVSDAVKYVGYPHSYVVAVSSGALVQNLKNYVG